MHIYRLNRFYQLSSAVEDLHAPLMRLWGKTTDDPELFHPAFYHMLDVGHVAYQLLSGRATPRWRRVLGRVLNFDADKLSDWLPWVIALHDIGKLSVPFQAQSVEQRQRLEAEGVLFGRYAPEHKALHQAYWNWPRRSAMSPKRAGSGGSAGRHSTSTRNALPKPGWKG